jgi:hypothetical protein
LVLSIFLRKREISLTISGSTVWESAGSLTLVLGTIHRRVIHGAAALAENPGIFRKSFLPFHPPLGIDTYFSDHVLPQVELNTKEKL